jgi:N-acylneuraminate cytidylyltransferase
MLKWPQNNLCEFVEFVDIYPIFMTEKNLCIIPARGGSKRIPRKNIKPFLGKPIIAYSIDAAKDSGLFEEVMVSTDDDEIADVAKAYGASVPFKRSSANADDHATTVDVILEVLKQYENQNKTFDYCCCIYPTAPLIQIDDLKEGFEKVKQGFDGAIPLVEFDYPIWRGVYIKNELVKMVWPENEQKRTQDLSKVYHDVGQWYWLKPKNLKQKQSLFTDNTTGLRLDSIYVQDIDEERDWQLAEMKYQLMFGSNGQ